MDTNQPPTFSMPPAPPPQRGIFRTKIPSAVTFAVAILLFLLPFAEIKCRGTTLVNKSGLDIALNNDWKAAQGGFFNKKDMEEKNDLNDKKSNAQIFAIAALGLGVLGLLLSFANNKTGGKSGLVTGILSAGSLIGLMIDMKSSFNNSLQAKDATNKTQEGMDNLGLSGIGESIADSVSLNFTPWFYVSIIAFFAAAFFCYLRMQSAKRQ